MKKYILILITILFSSCGVEKISEINSEPYKFHGKEVTIKGAVINTTNLLLVKTFKVSDKTGEITVVASQGRSFLPNEGEKIKIKGQVYQAFKLGPIQKTVILEQ
ncbi:MAG: hypothetical protein MJ211_09340 [Bacteroidales bacterium]|nr:hypothetical protein [Bacteroidales bacterium]